MRNKGEVVDAVLADYQKRTSGQVPYPMSLVRKLMEECMDAWAKEVGASGDLGARFSMIQEAVTSLNKAAGKLQYRYSFTDGEGKIFCHGFAPDEVVPKTAAPGQLWFSMSGWSEAHGYLPILHVQRMSVHVDRFVDDVYGALLNHGIVKCREVMELIKEMQNTPLQFSEPKIKQEYKYAEFRYAPMQKCPVCSGSGRELSEYERSIGWQLMGTATCSACGGTKMVPMNYVENSDKPLLSRCVDKVLEIYDIVSRKEKLVFDSHKSLDVNEMSYDLEEAELWEELSREFRQWNQSWDIHRNRDNVYKDQTTPINKLEFLNQMRTKFKLSKIVNSPVPGTEKSV